LPVAARGEVYGVGCGCLPLVARDAGYGGALPRDGRGGVVALLANLGDTR
jgi:hypothetical protein